MNPGAMFISKRIIPIAFLCIFLDLELAWVNCEGDTSDVLEPQKSSVPLLFFGKKDGKPLRISNPLDIAPDSHGYVCVLGQEGDVYIIHPSGKYFTMRRPDFRVDRIRYIATALDIDHIGDIALLDVLEKRLVKLDMFGTIRDVVQLDTASLPSIGLLTGLAIDTKGWIYITDRDRDTIYIFKPDGVLLKSIGMRRNGTERMNNPSGIAVDLSGDIYVADTYNHRIHVFDLTGASVRKIGRKGSESASLKYPTDVAVYNRWHIVAVADSGNKRIQCYTFDGEHKLSIPFSLPGQHNPGKPSKLAFDSGGNLYIIDSFSGKLVRIDGKDLNKIFAKKKEKM